jgi:hypothetical protein
LELAVIHNKMESDSYVFVIATKDKVPIGRVVVTGCPSLQDAKVLEAMDGNPLSTRFRKLMSFLYVDEYEDLWLLTDGTINEETLIVPWKMLVFSYEKDTTT